MTYIELENIMLSEVSQSVKEIPYDFTLMWNLRNKVDEHGGGGKRGKTGNRLSSL